MERTSKAIATATISAFAVVSAAAFLAGCGEQGGSAGPAAASVDVAAAGEGETRGELVADEPSVDFGSVWRGAELEHTFEVKSVGEVPAKVLKIRAGCACTVAEAWTVDEAGERVEYTPYDPLPPGKSLFVRAVIRTAGKVPAKSSDITLYADVPGERVKLALHVEVRDWLTVEPAELFYGRLTVRETRTAETRVASVEGEPFHLSVVEPEALDAVPEALALELVPETPDAEGRAPAWVVKSELGPGLAPGPLTARVRLATDVALEQGGAADARHGAEVWLIGTVVDLVSAAPMAVPFGVVRPDAISSRTVRIECFDETFELEEPEASAVDDSGNPFDFGTSLRFRSEPVEGANAWDVEIQLDGLPEALNGPFRGAFVFEVDHPDVFDVAVPFSGVARRDG